MGCWSFDLFRHTTGALYLLEVRRSRGRRGLQGKTPPPGSDMSIVAHFMPVSFVSSTGRGLKDIQGTGRKIYTFPEECRCQEKRCCVGLWIREEKVCTTAISVRLERYADKRQVSVSSIRFMSVRAELSPRYFCHEQL